jgi:outer membrane biosynthesis protein TonB
MMNRIARIALTAAAVSLGVLLAGCDTFDPTAIFDAEIFNTKKKLPGDRKPVFPDGTPGVPQGVPQELVKGYQATEPEPPPVAPEPKAEAKPKPKPKVVAKPKEQPAPAAAQPSQSQAQSQWPDPPPPQPSRPTAGGAWPSSPQPSGGGVAWPDPPSTTR